MNRILFYFGCCLSFLAGTAQTQETAVQIYDGTTIKIGDTIQAGHKSHKVQYLAIKWAEGRYYHPYKEDIAFSKLEVIEIRNTNWANAPSTKEAIIAVRELASGKELFININGAVSNGEVIVKPAQRLYPDATFLSNDLLLALVLRVNKQSVTDGDILSFIRLKDENLYNKCKSDEFEYNSVKPEYSKQLEDMVNNFDFTLTYYIDNTATIGKYDFTKNGYPINFTRKERWEFMNYGVYNFVFSASEPFRFISVTQEYGKEVNKRRQGGFGGVYGRFYFKALDKVTATGELNAFEQYLLRSLISADLVGVEVYDFKHCDYNFIGSVK
jgi:hypothetical protein